MDLPGIGEPRISPSRLGSRASNCLLAVAAACTLSACRAERHLIFETDPSGATVRIDDEIVGLTPLDLSFEHYGKRQLTIYREGYRTHSAEIDPQIPWYSHFPLDFISEVLLPFGWQDEHRYEIVLEEETGHVTSSDLDSVLQRAESLRRAGPSGPLQAPPNAELGTLPQEGTPPPKDPPR